MKHKVLFVDDMQNRHEVFLDAVRGKGWEIVMALDYTAAIDALQSNSYFDALYLDHDLSLSSIMCGPLTCTERTGTDLALWISWELKYRPPVWLHSHNSRGVASMKKILEHAGHTVHCVPFGKLINEFGGPK